jgi:polyphosphate kinase 2 (PPK2 family)
MFEETNTPVAPWKVVGANRKWHARIEVMRHVLRQLEAAFEDGEE